MWAPLGTLAYSHHPVLLHTLHWLPSSLPISRHLPQLLDRAGVAALALALALPLLASPLATTAWAVAGLLQLAGHNHSRCTWHPLPLAHLLLLLAALL
jgi:hypothetical protein